jgi:hypothetical protein
MADQLEAKADGKGDSRVQEIEALLEEGDRDALDLADQMVRWMSDELDKREDEGRAGTLRKEVAEHTEVIQELLKPDDVGERRQAKALTVEFDRAMARSDFETAQTKVDAMRSLATRLLRRHPDYWRAVFRWVCERIEAHGLQAKTRDLVAKGRRLAEAGNIGPLSEVCAELARMLPADEQEQASQQRVQSHVK